MSIEASAPRKGRGLNSIPIRFALMSAAMTTLCVGAWLYLWFGLGPAGVPAALIWTISALAVVVPASITFVAARKLTGQIRALRRSTEAIVAGDFDSPVEVDCACEVGGLADSFRKMVGRLNSNILRMNILAYSDAVTGLPNRAVVTHMLGFMTAPAHARPGAVLFIDLDGFKKVNDTLGHEAGDDLLRQVSLRIIREGLGRTPEQLDTCTTPFGELCQRPPEDIVFVRFAGDEFVALLPGTVAPEALAGHAEAILTALAEPFPVRGNTVAISASIGIARTPFDSADPAELLNFADLAMYAAKQAGKSRFAFFSPVLREAVIERNRIEADLRTALAAEDQLVLHYQPKVDANTLECNGVEALVRWRHPERGLVPPGAFIPVAEQAGLMPALGTAILRMAARQSRAWRDAGTPRRMAVNVSPAQFESPNLAAEMLAILEEVGVAPAQIELEITESMLSSDFALARMSELQRAGIEISIDDFGIGFSNLSQLAKLSFNTLKIDRSLIVDIGRSAKSEGIVRAIVDMSHALGHRTVAEGIETAEQLAFLQDAGCDSVQGFLFARPMPADQLDAWEAGRRQGSARRLQALLAQEVART